MRRLQTVHKDFSDQNCWFTNTSLIYYIFILRSIRKQHKPVFVPMSLEEIQYLWTPNSSLKTGDLAVTVTSDSQTFQLCGWL